MKTTFLFAAALALAASAPAQEKSLPGVLHVAGSADEIPRGSKTLEIEPMTAQQKFSWYRRHSFDVGSLLIPALPAAIIMADSPKHYPRDWRDGAPAFGRNFGDCLATELAANTARYLVGTLAHEDARYYPDRSKNAFHRTYHALAFTLVDRSDAGRPMLAISNLAGSAAAGFVGMAYLPSGYDDTVHAGQRAAGTLGGYVPTLLVGYATGNCYWNSPPNSNGWGASFTSRSFQRTDEYKPIDGRTSAVLDVFPHSAWHWHFTGRRESGIPEGSARPGQFPDCRLQPEVR